MKLIEGKALSTTAGRAVAGVRASHRTFSRVATQWRVGAGGPIGLDYNVVYRELEREALDGDQHDEVMAAIRIIERAALEQMQQE
jgi:hypothetical protein